MSQKHLLINGELNLQIFKFGYCFRGLIFLLSWSNAGRDDCETLVIVIFEQSMELAFYSSWKGFGLSEEEESWWVGKFNKIIEGVLTSFTPCYVLFDRIKYNMWPLFGFILCQSSKFFIYEIIVFQLYVWFVIKCIFSQYCFYSSRML